MFEKRESSIGGKTALHYFSSKLKTGLTLIPSQGANLVELHLPNAKGEVMQVVDGISTEKEIQYDEKFKSAYLIPFPNRVRDGVYQFRGKQYKLNCNEEALNNAIHGIVYNMPFEVAEEDLTGDILKVKLSLDYKGTDAGYPFPFSLLIQYTLDTTEGLTVKVDAKNTGTEALPIGFGWHPYYKMQSPIEKCALKMPASESYNLDNRFIPNGLSVPFSKFQVFETIGDFSIDTCFLIKQKPGRVSVYLSDPAIETTLDIWQNNDESQLNYLVAYIPPDRESIAVEPMSCCTNAFNSGEGLVILGSGNSTQWEFGVKTIFNAFQPIA